MAQKQPIEYDKMNSLISELKIEVNQKEDDLKNIINEKDEIIKELENKIEKMNKKLEKIIDVFINEFKEKDKKITQITINLLEQEILIENKDKQIKKMMEENIFEINNKIIEQEQKIIKDLNQKFNNLNKELKQLKERQTYNINNLEEKFLVKLNEMKEELYGIINHNNEIQRVIKGIEKSELYNEIKIYLALEEEIPEIKQKDLDHINIKNFIDQYLRLTTNKINQKKNMIKLETHKKIFEIKKESK